MKNCHYGICFTMYVPTKGDDTAHHRPAGRQFAATGLPFLTQTIVDQGIGHRNLNFIQLYFGRTTHAGIQPHTY